MHKLVVALIAAGIVSGTAFAQSTPLKIGFVAELSGPQAPLGQDQYDALMLVIEQNGGKLGGVPVQVRAQGRLRRLHLPARNHRG